VRVIAASGGDLETLVRERKFRADLFFRLNVLQLTLPALRERPADIPLLARHFVAQACDEASVPRKELTTSALDCLARAPWPGNVRQLLNVVQHAVIFCEGRLILDRHLSLKLPAHDRDRAKTRTFSHAKADAVRDFERRYVETLLAKHDGNVTRAAADAGKERRAFGRLVKKHGLSVQRHS
jgi:DNA-binding NtrC family response regulator